MLYFIENENFKVGVESLGAELQHLIKKDEDLELIWTGDPEVWAGRAPNLFPIVGELPHQQYLYEGQAYTMARHGFARRSEFELVEEHRHKLVFELKYNDETLAQYPFKFRLLVAYKLEGNQLDVTYQVYNENSKTMYFSVGGHPGFNVPFYSHEQYSDYYLEFEESEALRRHLLTDKGLLNGDTELLMERGSVLPLNHSLFAKDAIVLKNLNSERVTLASKNSALKIALTYKGFPYLGIWSKPGNAPFVCIEPWCGIASSATDGGELKEKEGINELAPKQVFERTFSIAVL